MKEAPLIEVPARSVVRLCGLRGAERDGDALTLHNFHRDLSEPTDETKRAATADRLRRLRPREEAA